MRIEWQSRTGAPGSHQRTWDDDDLFPLLSQNGATALTSVAVAKAMVGLTPYLFVPRYPGFPVEAGGVVELHAAFRKESRTRGPV
jgi:hypothetical protein